MIRTLKSLARKVIPGRSRKGTLVYVGMHRGGGFEQIFRRYKRCYGFEANPELFKTLEEKFGDCPGVKLFNVAVADHDGELEFNISSNDGESSSIGHFSEDWNHFKSGDIAMTSTITVPCINLCRFLRDEKVRVIDDYVSDIQGFDLEVLKTLKPLLDAKKIHSITCEVAKDTNIYHDLPDNSEEGFDALLRENYECVAKGWGVLTDGEFSDVPEDWWEMDCKWRKKPR